MNDKDDDQTNDIQAMRCEILGISAATSGGEKGITLAVRANPNSFEVTELFFRVAQAQERLQIDVADLLERSPVFNEAN